MTELYPYRATGMLGVGSGVTMPQWAVYQGVSVSAPTPSQPQSPAQQAAQQRATEKQFTLPSGLVEIEFGVVDLAAGLTDSQLYRVIGGSSIVARQIPTHPPFRGSVVALCIRSDSTLSAGTATFTAFVNDEETVATVVWDESTHIEQTFPAGSVPFAVGDSVDIRVTTSGSFSPTTSDVQAIAYLAQTT